MWHLIKKATSLDKVEIYSVYGKTYRINSSVVNKDRAVKCLEKW